MLAIGFLIVAIVAFTIGLFLSGNSMQPVEANNSKSKNLDQHAGVSGLTAENLKDREKAAEAIRNERAQLIKQLIKLAAEKVERLHPDDPKSSYPWCDSKHLAVLLLGDLRAVEAVPVLLENLEYKNPRSIVTEYLDKGGWYPAVEALSKIGIPAIGPTIEKLGRYPPKSKGNELCCWMLKKILGVKLARLRLQIAIEETRDEAVKNNFTTVLPYFKTEQEKAAEERARREKSG